MHPMQEIVKDQEGTIRFRGNEIVQYLLETHHYNLNDLMDIPFSKDDWAQFMMLIGYSVSGYADLDCGHPEQVDRAFDIAEKMAS